MKLNLRVMLGATAIAMMSFGTSAWAQDCPRGDLDDRFCDVDGDLIADIPTDPAQQINPDTLIFAYTPVEDPAVYKTAWSDFLEHLEAETGKDVVFFPVQSNAAQIEAMRSGRLHIAGFNTGSNPLAVNCAGFRPFTIMASKDGNFGTSNVGFIHGGEATNVVTDRVSLRAEARSHDPEFRKAMRNRTCLDCKTEFLIW